MTINSKSVSISGVPATKSALFDLSLAFHNVYGFIHVHLLNKVPIGSEGIVVFTQL